MWLLVVPVFEDRGQGALQVVGATFPLSSDCLSFQILIVC